MWLVQERSRSCSSRADVRRAVFSQNAVATGCRSGQAETLALTDLGEVTLAGSGWL